MASNEHDPLFDDVEPAFVRLSARRDVARRDWPLDLCSFYTEHEGTGLGGSPGFRLAKVDQVSTVAWKDLGLSPDPPHQGWASFSAMRIGFSDYGDEIVYVLHAPGIPKGSILALGVGAMTGPAGDDKGGPVGALVLAASLEEWITRMGRFGHGAHGLYVDIDQPDWVIDLIEHRIAELNPHSSRGRKV